MRRGPLKRRDREALKSRIDDISMIRDFYTKSNMEDVRFTSIENMDQMDLVDGVTIPDIMVAQRDDGHSDIFNRYTVMEIEPQVLDEIEVRGLPKEKALTLVEDGMQPDEILQAVSTSQMSYPGLDEDSMMLMIQNQIEPEMLENLEVLGLTAVPLEDGSVRVQAIAKIAEVDEEGKTVLAPKIKDQLEAFEQVGMIELGKDLTVEIVKTEPKSKSKSKSKNKSKSKSESQALAQADGEEQEEEQDLAKDMQEAEEEQEEQQEELEEEREEEAIKELKIVPMREKARAKTQDELEKEKIAKQIGCKPDEVLCVIRFSSREVASQYFNDSVGGNTTAVLVRLTNNKFWMMEEDAEGNFTKRQGLRTSPASMLLADKLKDTKHPGDTWVLPGELKSGKSHEHSERYDFFEVMLPGETKTDGASSVMYVGLNADNTQDMRLLTSRRNNVYDLGEPHSKTSIPSRAFMQSNSGARAEIKMRNVEGEEGLDSRTQEIEEESTTSLADLGKQQELLIRLEMVERAITTLEIRNGGMEAPEPPKPGEKRPPERILDPETIGEGIDTSKKLDDLYAQRSSILTQLGLSEADLVKLMDERTNAQDGPVRGEKRPH